MNIKSHTRTHTLHTTHTECTRICVRRTGLSRPSPFCNDLHSPPGRRPRTAGPRGSRHSSATRRALAAGLARRVASAHLAASAPPGRDLPTGRVGPGARRTAPWAPNERLSPHCCLPRFSLPARMARPGTPPRSLAVWSLSVRPPASWARVASRPLRPASPSVPGPRRDFLTTGGRVREPRTGSARLLACSRACALSRGQDEGSGQAPWSALRRCPHLEGRDEDVNVCCTIVLWPPQEKRFDPMNVLVLWRLGPRARPGHTGSQ